MAEKKRENKREKGDENPQENRKDRSEKSTHVSQEPPLKVGKKEKTESQEQGGKEKKQSPGKDEKANQFRMKPQKGESPERTHCGRHKSRFVHGRVRITERAAPSPP